MTRVGLAWPIAYTLLAVALETWALPVRQHWAPLGSVVHHVAFGLLLATAWTLPDRLLPSRLARVLGSLGVLLVSGLLLVDAFHMRATGGRMPRQVLSYLAFGGEDWEGTAIRLALASIWPWAHEGIGITAAVLGCAWVFRTRWVPVSTRTLAGLGSSALVAWWFAAPQLVQGVSPRIHHRLVDSWPLPKVAPRPPAPIYEAPIVARAGRPANVVVVVMESVRFDRIGAWNPALAPDPMPFVSTLAREGLQVDTAHTTVSHTSKATWGLLCGTWPALTWETPEVDGPVRCLPRLLGEVGYRTTYVHGSRRDFEGWDALVDSMGFERSVHFEDLAVASTGPFGAADGELLPAVGEALDGREPFLLVVQTASAHYPYTLPGQEVPGSRADLRRAYETGALPYTDRFVAAVFAALEDRDLLEDTVLVVTSDHGEAFGDYGTYVHDHVPQEVVQRVPLLLHTPTSWGLRGRKVDGLRHHLDVVPTLLELLQIPWTGTLPGRSLLGDAPSTSLTSCWLSERCVGWRTETHKLVHHFGRQRDQRFDRVLDPEERRDLGPPEDVAYDELVHRLRSIDAFWESAR